jgi:hypothetical protein
LCEGAAAELALPYPLGDSQLSYSDIIGTVSVIVALMVWYWPRSPKAPNKGDIEPILPSPSEPDPGKTAISEPVEIPFPPGLLILEYEPGVRLRIGEYTLKKEFNKFSLIFTASFVLIWSVLIFMSDSFAGILSFILGFMIWRRSVRSRTTVSLNIAKRIFFVTHPGGYWGGGWPPNIGLQVQFNESTDGQWVTSLYLATVCVWSIKTKKPNEGREKIKPFVEALSKITALKQHAQTGVFDILAEQLLYL